MSGVIGPILSGLSFMMNKKSPDPNNPRVLLAQRVRDPDGLTIAEREERKRLADVKRQEDFQREFAQMGIRWRVEDARAAGLHPLAALGTSGASGSPVAMQFPDGQGLGVSAVRQETAAERVLMALQIYTAFAAAERDFAQASMFRSEAARRDQAGVNSTPLVLPSGGGAPLQPGQSATAQRMQDEYGDIVENVYGVWRLVDDVMTGRASARRPGLTEEQQRQLARSGYYVRPSRHHRQHEIYRQRDVFGVSSGE